MSFHIMPPAAPRPGDSARMAQALDRLLLESINARRPAGNNYQIKVTPDLSYYPDKGTILPDNSSLLEVRGLDALINFMRETGRLPSPASV